EDAGQSPALAFHARRADGVDVRMAAAVAGGAGLDGVYRCDIRAAEPAALVRRLGAAPSGDIEAKPFPRTRQGPRHRDRADRIRDHLPRAPGLRDGGCDSAHALSPGDFTAPPARVGDGRADLASFP